MRGKLESTTARERWNSYWKGRNLGDEAAKGTEKSETRDSLFRPTEPDIILFSKLRFLRLSNCFFCTGAAVGPIPFSFSGEA